MRVGITTTSCVCWPFDAFALSLGLILLSQEAVAQASPPLRLSLRASRSQHGNLDRGGRGDNGSRELFERMTIDEEQHVDFLEAQLDMIKQMGLPNYLAQQMKGA